MMIKFPKRQPLPSPISSDTDWLRIPEVQPKKQYRYTGNNRTIEKIWKIALDDIEKSFNTVTEYGTVFSAGAYGKDFSSLVFCRDNAYAGILALNLLYPQEILEAHKAIRKIRERLGWACFERCGCVLEGIPDVKVVDLSIQEFFKKYQKASAINKTDDVVWIWSFYDLLKKNNFGEDEWKYLWKTAKQNFTAFYDPFYDPSDGLYYGQPSFIDIGGSGYPKGYNKIKRKCRNRCVWVKASSTNALYYKALCVMTELAGRFGSPEEVVFWKQRAEKLQDGMLRLLRFPDGTFTYFLHRDGTQEPRREVLGTAFPVLCGVVGGEDARRALAGYPVTQYGLPLIDPYYPRHDTYHNNSMWPFADTFYFLAYERAYGQSCTDINRMILLNAFQNGHFKELRDARANVAVGSFAQLWTTAAFLNCMIRTGETEMDSHQNDIY